MEAKANPEFAAYLHVAFSFVVTRRVAVVVPAASVPDGKPPERVGGVMSGGAEVFAQALLEGAESAAEFRVATT